MDMEGILKEKNYNFKEIVKEFSIIERLKKVKQNPEYHGEGSVYKHTELVCREILKLEEWKTLNDREKVVLYTSALFHDIGKLVTTREENGKIISPRHALKGAKMFRYLAYTRYEIENSIREESAALIRYHGLPLYFLERENMDYDIIKAAEITNMKLLYLLAKCDLLGRFCKDKEIMLDNIGYFKTYSKELGCFYGRKKFKNEYTRFLYFKEKKIHPEAEMFDNRGFGVVAMMGLPLAGKDTYIKENFKNINVISLDDIREELNISSKRNSGKVAAIAISRAKQLLRRKESFIWNATNLRRENRQKLIRLCTAYGAKLKFIYLEVPYRELLSRNKMRSRYVPVEVINKMIRKMDMLEGEEICR
ncbi:putative nucleotidyltransferase with HDIG domain [Clostridium acetobutylicum]|uniref:PolyA polymerase related protein (HD hydrolase) and P-loop ATP-ase domain n=1 Tax=Clostridium acetobutylicum (strain ATCC 824 / DSM 792 / JCM 1419 / IAM 19013 / LMG 5710 / NBRC 13948 / NRRL B-527 / VKM B-1787 / 2291 / W) TaxID=272562 RepID=Q97L13_CLOAB|nr:MULTISPECIES: AAA family ATPase [Clostridium]AAK78729.1 PolyA polymerase related protein (HD hydrolase) and P-loop ATP-ase domain [Clostridium acetobutylicum ATCC 824]ADZ19803.1 PolyA polymerase related protein (HD hydrolase) and P-loop ATP-ase domain protein [Clostridium acetobutylicum EA 2018]AEI31417.1 PolyA polymerase-like protein [Clostridium acetobutylicum DSM 1731]AWV80448.1 HDIG domain-containing protein [Clostridium acetobutylicum]MBC2392638.1 AAA family ATPase [Clostridium acetobu